MYHKVTYEQNLWAISCLLGSPPDYLQASRVESIQDLVDGVAVNDVQCAISGEEI